MISAKKIKEISKKEGKKIEKRAANKLVAMLEDKLQDAIKKAARNSDFAGRNTIKEEDIVSD
ncbi:hypothetical protein A3K73_00135 [Candidatus Pacearchaeota archaeon RBG_13_36_9]|nr:MAG: hypothetical protein A3K73_00135 [Candidatus Pacearchaeota archaeon RBG_13_36_9]